MSNVRFKIKDELCSTTANRLRAGVVTIAYKEFIDQQSHPDNIYRNGDMASEIESWQELYFEYLPNNDGCLVPVLVLPAEEVYPDLERDKFYFISKATINGIVYDKWQKIESSVNNPDPVQTWTSTAKQFIYTNVIVEETPLNNFGLAELTLKTANKWCTADIDVKIDSAELENIKPEYLRSGVEVFGITGTYGDAINDVIIPAGIYEIVYRPTGEWFHPTNINFYYCGALYNSFDVESGNVMGFNGSSGSSSRVFSAGSSAVEPNGSEVAWLDYLVYVPNDVTTTRANAEAWYSQMHPYVSCLDQDTKQELSATTLANQIMSTIEESCPNCGSSDYEEYEGEMRCNHCYYPYSGYCDEHGYYNTYYESVCPGCYPYQCFHCDARFESKEALEEHQINDLGYTRCEYCGQLYDPESGQHECSGTCNHSYGDYGSSVYISGYSEGYHIISCRFCDYETTESCSIGDDNTCTICGQSYNTPDDASCFECGYWASNICDGCGNYFCDEHLYSHSCGSSDDVIDCHPVCPNCGHDDPMYPCDCGYAYVGSRCGTEGCSCPENTQ